MTVNCCRTFLQDMEPVLVTVALSLSWGTALAAPLEFSGRIEAVHRSEVS